MEWILIALHPILLWQSPVRAELPKDSFRSARPNRSNQKGLGQANETFAMFDHLMQLAQNRRFILLREMSASAKTLPESMQRQRST
jgi:hypothetical protein